MMQKQETPRALIYTVFLFFTMPLFFVPAKPLADADTGWHIMAGYNIMHNWYVPEENIFSFTAGDYPWLNISWLWDIFAALVDSVGGLYLLSALTIIGGGLTMATLVWFCLKRDSGTVATLFAVVFGMFGFMPALLVRPHQATNIFTLCFTIILYFFADNPRYWRKLLLLPLIMLFWANMHGGFFTGFTIIGAYLCQFFFQKRWGDLAVLTAYSALTFAAVFITPLGVDIFTASYRTLGGPMKAYIDEWRSPHDVRDFIYICIFAVVFIFSFRIHPLAEKIICVFWLAETLLAVRNLPIFMIVSAPVIASGIFSIGRYYQIYRDRENDYSHEFSKTFFTRLTYTLAIILSLFFVTPLWQQIINFKVLAKNYPREEIAYIMKEHPQERLFNHYDYGGYVIYESKSHLQTFIDGRAETAFPPSLVRDYLLFDTATDGWEKLLDKYNIDTVLMPKNLGVQLDYFNTNPHWQKSFEGPLAVVYLRKR